MRLKKFFWILICLNRCLSSILWVLFVMTISVTGECFYGKECLVYKILILWSVFTSFISFITYHAILWNCIFQPRSKRQFFFSFTYDDSDLILFSFIHLMNNLLKVLNLKRNDIINNKLSFQLTRKQPQTVGNFCFKST